MNDDLDPQLDALLSESFAAHGRKAGRPRGRIDDVMKRVARRRARRRSLAGAGAFAAVAAGIGGIVAVGQIDRGDTARSAGEPPVSVVADGSWFVCAGMNSDGHYQSCELETAYVNPVWQCSGSLDDPAVDGDDRPRFEQCTAVGGVFGDSDCDPMVAPATIAIAPVEGASPVAPPSTSVDEVCFIEQPFPSVPPGTAPSLTVPCVSAVEPGSSGCDPMAPVDVRADSTPVPPSAPPASTPAGTVPVTFAPLATVPPSTMALPSESPRVLALGDSVMLGAADVLAERGWTVWAGTAMQLVHAVGPVEQMAAAGVFADTEAVVLHLGTNGTFSADDLDALLAPLADVPNVLLYTIHADRSWTEPNNELLRAAADARDNIVLIDFAAEAVNCEGACFAGDGIHLDQDGKRFFADLARDWTGM